MNIKMITLLSALSIVLSSNLYANAVQQQLDLYQQQGAGEANMAQGKELWYSKNAKGRSCTSCHSQSLKQEGQHVKTKKRIKAMAVSVNPSRYQSARKIDKWFLRNCKWTLGRVCSAQEKTNILSWLNSQ